MTETQSRKWKQQSGEEGGEVINNLVDYAKEFRLYSVKQWKST